MAKRTQSRSVRNMSRKDLKRAKGGTQLQPFSPTFRGGISVAVGDVDKKSTPAALGTIQPCL